MQNTDFEKKVLALADKLKDKTIEWRRNFHKHPESGWTEFRTAALVADALTEWGYEVSTGDAVIKEDAMMGVPSKEELSEHEKRALAQNANPHWVEKMKGGKTGVVGILRGAKPGAVVALRFDMDCNEVIETTDPNHLPNKFGFASINAGYMHACGHDSHIAMGLTLAEILAQLKDELCGTVKLIFQPAEEGGRGSKAMVAAGVADDVDFMLCTHVGFKADKTGGFCCNVYGFLANSRYDAIFTGAPTHAGATPERGKNALLAAACAALNMHAIPRHSEGASRINVGVLNAGSSRNVLPANAIMKFETRGATSTINDYMSSEATRILNAAAQMYDVGLKIKIAGSAPSASNSPELAAKIEALAERLALFETIMPKSIFGASDDFTSFMERVQQNNKQAAYLMIGSNLAGKHHEVDFDFDESVLDGGLKLLAVLTTELMAEQPAAK